MEIADNGKSTYFLYDDAGERVLKRGQHGETFYINRFYSIKNGELGTKSIYAGNTRVASKLVKTPNTATANTATSIPGIQGLGHGLGNKTGIINRLPDSTSTGILPPEEKDQYFYHGDHLGSSNMITDAAGSVYQHLEYFPFGETWIDEGKTRSNIPGYQFTGKELDPETGLYYFGARYYEPVISRWISADPVLDKYLPMGNHEKDQQLAGMGGVYNFQNLSLYGYSHQNPLKFVDPDGNSPASALQLISKYRQTINWAAGVHGVSPQAIASIIFQEKLEGPWATLADIPARAHAGAFNSDKANRRSIGLAEMQVGRAAELLGLDISNRGDQKKAIAALDNDTTSIDLIARNIADYQKKLDRPLTVKEATVGHNAGEKGLMSFVKGEVKNTSRQNLF